MMNERIAELIEKSGILFYEGRIPETGFEYEGAEVTKEDLEKFAQLLIKDVLSELERERGYYAEPSTYQEIQYYIRCAAKEEILAELIRTFKIQYGMD